MLIHNITAKTLRVNCGVLALLSALVYLSWTLGNTSLNTQLFLEINQTVNLYKTANIWIFITNLGDASVLICIALMLIQHQKTQYTAQLLFAILLVTLATAILKQLTDMDRPMKVLGYFPDIFYGEKLSYNSFPSGHTAAAVLLCSFVWLNKFSKHIVASCLILAVLVAISRIAVAAHWPADVLAGSALGILLPLVIYKFNISNSNSGSNKIYFNSAMLLATAALLLSTLMQDIDNLATLTFRAILLAIILVQWITPTRTKLLKIIT
jgi:membrane-associated phospholipid phosphatase